MPRRDDWTLVKDMLDAAQSAMAAIKGRDGANLSTDRVWALGLVKQGAFGSDHHKSLRQRHRPQVRQ